MGVPRRSRAGARPAWRAVPAASALCATLALPAPAEEIRVVATIKPLHSLASAVMAGVAEPHLLMRDASSPHTFSLRPSDAAVLEDAHVVFLIGETLEASLAGPIDTLAEDAQVVELAEAPGLVRRPLREGGTFEDHDEARHGEVGGHDGDGEAERDHDRYGDGQAGGAGDRGAGRERDGHAGEAGHDGDHGPYDIHVWLDPLNGAAIAATIASTLAEADPANGDTYAANAEGLAERLAALHREVADRVQPIRGMPFFVFHDAYRHFEDRFGLTAAGSATVSPERPPGVRRVAAIRDKVRAVGATCIFSEPQFDDRLVRVIAEGTAARVGSIDPLGAAIDSGPELYFALIRNMAGSFTDCLVRSGSDG